jgi:hypothetical protein
MHNARKHTAKRGKRCKKRTNRHHNYGACRAGPVLAGGCGSRHSPTRPQSTPPSPRIHSRWQRCPCSRNLRLLQALACLRVRPEACGMYASYLFWFLWLLFFLASATDTLDTGRILIVADMHDCSLGKAALARCTTHSVSTCSVRMTPSSCTSPASVKPPVSRS